MLFGIFKLTNSRVIPVLFLLSCTSLQKEQVVNRLEDTTAYLNSSPLSQTGFDKKKSELKAKFYKTNYRLADLSGQKYQSDTISFWGYDTNGDHHYLKGIKDNRIVSFIYDWDLYHDLNRGDKVLISWRSDSSWIAGEGEKPGIQKKVSTVTVIKEGKVSAFKRMHPVPLRYSYHDNMPYTSGMLETIYKEVEFYLSTTKQPLVIYNLQTSYKDLIYSIEPIIISGKEYTLIEITNKVQRVPIQWLCIDADNTIYEYDFIQETLKKFTE